ncbi:MAG: Sec-dependent nitrous-oxide reductase [Thaumarchaeota archaeon]|nr:Sec-dependent nitrous-oxide reductase [Nitrososphaerota archaeon]
MGVISEKKLKRREFLGVAGAGLAAGAAIGFGAGRLVTPQAPATTGMNGLEKLMLERKLEPKDAEAALRTYLPGGKYDEFVAFSSGGHSGQVIVIGVPSMKILKYIAVFTPEPWQGYGYGSVETSELLQRGNNGVRNLTGADTHHPEFSRRNAEYDGEWCFIGDKISARMAAISLRDFRTKDLFKIPNMQSQHGGACATPNTEYIGCGSQFPTPWKPGEGYKPGVTYYQLTEANYRDYFRGSNILIAFDRNTGRYDLSRSFQIELPPYMQDLEVIGWGPADGWLFTNSINTEMAIGGVKEGRPALEVAASQKDFDYLHIINWKKAEQVVRAGGAKQMNGINVISLETAIKEGILYFAPEPKSPHGCDLSPSGRYLAVGGKLAPVVTLYDIEKIKTTIADGKFEGTDPFGVPVLRFEDVKSAQVEIGGLGPLHNEFDNKGHGYVSCFISNEVVKYSLGAPDYSGSNPFQVVDRIQVNYNIGHLVTTESNTPSPKGKYLIALNKWSIDRFSLVGPLHPQNFQLIDISGEKMNLLYDLPIPLGEPHYVKMISADKLKPLEVYPVGTNPATFQLDANAVQKGRERVERHSEGGKMVTEVWATLLRSTISPDIIRAKQGDIIRLHLTNPETVRDGTHGFTISEYNIMASIDPGEVVNIEFVADKPGVYNYYCLEFCSPLHLEMAGWLEISPQ